ncbi:hypothetical protein IAT40_006919 [Kwoniella sp. CBS 6097]
MATLISALAHSDDLLNLPGRFLHTLSKGNQSMDTFIPMAIRAIVVAALFAMIRRGFKHMYNRINRKLFPTAYIQHGDPAYDWIKAWIAQDTYALSQIHDFQLSTTDVRSMKKRAKNALAVGQHNASWAMNDVIGQIMPTYQHSLRIKYQGNYLWITRRASGFAGGGALNHFRIQTIAWRPNVLKDFLIAAHAAYFAKEERELIIFHAKRINPTWQNPVSRPARPWSSVILPGTLKDDLLKDVERFLSEKESKWYASRGIPHRRGYLFHGAPGAGKTTLVTAIASKLALDIYVINPSQRGMDDAKLSKLFRDCPAKSVILIEDIDCIFPRGRNHHTTPSVEEESAVDGPAESSAEVTDEPPAETILQASTGNKHDLAPSTVTMSGVLNAIDGVSSQEGCVLIATTNHPNRLDPALCRAGRFDIRVEFTYAVPEQVRGLYLHFYPLDEFSPAAAPVSDEKKILNVNGGTAVIDNQAKLDELADSFVKAVFPPPSDVNCSSESDVKVNGQCDAEKSVNAIRSAEHSANGACEADTGIKFQVSGTAKVNGEVPLTPKTPGNKDEKPKISMAALQAYLLQYKEDPFGACEKARKWVEDEIVSGKDKYVSTNPDNFKYGLSGIKIEGEDEDGNTLTNTNGSTSKAKTNLKLGGGRGNKKKKAEKKSTKTVEAVKPNEDAPAATASPEEAENGFEQPADNPEKVAVEGDHEFL